MNINEKWYHNSLADEGLYRNSIARHPINFFSNYFERFNQTEELDFRIHSISKAFFKTLGLTLDIITAPIRLPYKAFGMIYSHCFFVPLRMGGVIYSGEHF